MYCRPVVNNEEQRVARTTCVTNVEICDEVQCQGLCLDNVKDCLYFSANEKQASNE